MDMDGVTASLDVVASLRALDDRCLGECVQWGSNTIFVKIVFRI